MAREREGAMNTLFCWVYVRRMYPHGISDNAWRILRSLLLLLWLLFYIYPYEILTALGVVSSIGAPACTLYDVRNQKCRLPAPVTAFLTLDPTCRRPAAKQLHTVKLVVYYRCKESLTGQTYRIDRQPTDNRQICCGMTSLTGAPLGTGMGARASPPSSRRTRTWSSTWSSWRTRATS